MKPRVPLLPLAALALLSGCGGGGGGTTLTPDPLPLENGRLAVNIAWPEPSGASRLVPENALSIRIEILRNGSPIRSMLVAKPATQAAFNELPLGAASVRATAYPDAGGTGVALASATVGTTIAEAPATIPITMASTVATLAMVPATVSLVPGTTQNAAAVAKNAGGAVILVPAAALSYVSSAPAMVRATKNSDGTVALSHLAGVGSATITATESGSGRTATLPVSVAARVTITPATTSVSVGANATFSATVTGPANTAVTWSVQEGNGGTVTSAGVYTAPATRGTYHVIATSVADPTRKATATVTVRSGSGTVNVN